MVSRDRLQRDRSSPYPCCLQAWSEIKSAVFDHMFFSKIPGLTGHQVGFQRSIRSKRPTRTTSPLISNWSYPAKRNQRIETGMNHVELSFPHKPHMRQVDDRWDIAQWIAIVRECLDLPHIEFLQISEKCRIFGAACGRSLSWASIPKNPKSRKGK
jgi:hypothetical protein